MKKTKKVEVKKTDQRVLPQLTLKSQRIRKLLKKKLRLKRNPRKKARKLKSLRSHPSH